MCTTSSKKENGIMVAQGTTFSTEAQGRILFYQELAAEFESIVRGELDIVQAASDRLRRTAGAGIAKRRRNNEVRKEVLEDLLRRFEYTRLEGLQFRTPAEWDKLEEDGLEIMDPDGWRSALAPSWDTPITREEFRERRMQSTLAPRGT